jgi:NADPH:quinone reductase-like Zn-dependent oxidoreductase
MTRKVVASAYGGSEVLTTVSENLTEPGPGKVLVSVRAIGVNQADIKSYQGLFGTDPANLPLKLGYEAAGVIEAVGPDVTNYAVSDEVIVYPANGTYATDVLVGVAALTPKPASLSWEQAAGLLLTGVTAVHALTAAGVGEGDTVLIHGGAGGVGQIAVQLAVAHGASVVATAAPRDHELVRSLGAAPVEYGDGLLRRVQALAPNGVTAALDLVGSDEALEVSLAVVEDRSRIATIANFGSSQGTGIKILGAGPNADPGTEIRRAARSELARLAGEGKIKVTVSGTYSLDDVAAAHEFLASGVGAGKVILLP